MRFRLGEFCSLAGSGKTQTEAELQNSDLRAEAEGQTSAAFLNLIHKIREPQAWPLCHQYLWDNTKNLYALCLDVFDVGGPRHIFGAKFPGGSRFQ